MRMSCRLHAIQVHSGDGPWTDFHFEFHVLEISVESRNEENAEEGESPFRQRADDVVEAVLWKYQL